MPTRIRDLVDTDLSTLDSTKNKYVLRYNNTTGKIDVVSADGILVKSALTSTPVGFSSNVNASLDTDNMEFSELSGGTFRNNPIVLADNIRPTKTLITEAIKEFKDIAAQKGLKLNDDLARDMVDDVWKGASMPKGFTLGERTAPGQVRFQNVPAFMTKSLGDKITQKTIRDTDTVNIEEL